MADINEKDILLHQGEPAEAEPAIDADQGKPELNAAEAKANAAKAAPRGVANPVHAFTAVSKKPTMMATAKPNNISCPCHSSAGSGKGNAAWPANISTHNGTDTQASNAVSK